MYMKTGKSVIVVIAVVLALILIVIAGLPLISRLVYHRSQAATLLAWQLQKESYTTEEAFEDYLAQKRLENGAPYVFPQELDMPVPVTHAMPDGMQFTILNADAMEDRTVFYFPGGSYIDQPAEVHWQFAGRLAADTDSAVVVPIYPKLPANDAESCLSALRDAYDIWLDGHETGEIVFMGDSAGGGLALSFAMQLRDAGLEGPDRLILICPWLDVTLTNPEIPAYERKDPKLDSEQLRHLGALWAGELSPADPLVSPLYGSFEDLGAITLITGTAELLYPDITAMHEKLSAAGIPHEFAAWEGMFHVFPLYLAYNLTESLEACDQIVGALNG